MDATFLDFWDGSVSPSSEVLFHLPHCILAHDQAEWVKWCSTCYTTGSEECARHSTINSDAAHFIIKEELLGINKGPKAARLAWRLSQPALSKQPGETPLMMNLRLGVPFVLGPFPPPEVQQSSQSQIWLVPSSWKWAHKIHYLHKPSTEYPPVARDWLWILGIKDNASQAIFEIQWLRVRVYFWALDSLLLIYMLILAPTPYCLDSYGFTVSFEIG